MELETLRIEKRYIIAKLINKELANLIADFIKIFLIKISLV